VIEIDVPGAQRLTLEHLVCDFNGTLAFDGVLIDGVRNRLQAIGAQLSVHVVTADTFGAAREALAGLALELTILPAGEQSAAKAGYVARCGAARTVAIGNGRNDRGMLETAALGIAVLGPEGTAAESIAAATVVTPDIRAALDLLAHPRRLAATLRR
jgi:soluble P-type ATPase